MNSCAPDVRTGCRSWRRGLLLTLLSGGLFCWVLPSGLDAKTEEHTNPCVVAREMASKGVALFGNQPDQGLAAMEGAAKMCLSDPSIAFNLGLAHYLAGHLDAAESVWDSLYTAPSAVDAPNREKVLTNLAWLKFELGKDKEAFQLATDALALFPGSWALAHTKLFSLLRMGRYLEAYDWLSRSGFSGIRAAQWQHQAAEYLVETLWRKFRECLAPRPGEPCENSGQLPAIRRAVNLLVKEYPQEPLFVEAKNRLLSAYLDKGADVPHPIDLPHEAWAKTGNVDDTTHLLDEQIKVLPPIAQWEKREDAFAVIVGISHYQHLRARHFADRDAQHMRQLLVQRGAFKGDVDHVRLRVNQEANRATLQDDLAWLIRQGQLNPTATLLFYFSGLGVAQPGPITLEDALLLPVDVQLEEIKPETALSLNTLKAALDKLPNPQVAVILDTCFNETKECAVYQGIAAPQQVARSNTPVKGAPLHGLAPTPEFFNSRHTWVVSALQRKPLLHTPGRQGGLTYFLLRSMLGEGHAARGDHLDGWVDLTEAFAFAKKNMSETDPFLSKPTRVRLTKPKGEQ
ncbi:MAG: caspase family protein [Magnetococcus sp. XQGC-1]